MYPLTPTMEPLLTVEETAGYLRISRKTLYRLTSRNAIPHLRTGGELRFRASDLEAWLNRGPAAS